MPLASKEELLRRIETLLDQPGMCLAEHRTAILDVCRGRSPEQLVTIAARLRVDQDALMHFWKQHKGSLTELKERLDSIAPAV